MVLAVLTLLVLILPGCSRDKQEPAAEKPKATVADKPELPPGGMDSIKGRVLEVVDTDSFIFILLDRGEKQTWATIPPTDVKVGEEITLVFANVFANFSSKSMGRTFDELIFAGGIEGRLTEKGASTSFRKKGRMTRKTVAAPPSSDQ